MHGELGWVHMQPIRVGGEVLWRTCGQLAASRGGSSACTAKHQELFSRCWEFGKEDQKWGNSILTTWFLSGQEFYVLWLWYQQGSSIQAQAAFFFYNHMYVCAHVNAHKKIWSVISFLSLFPSITQDTKELVSHGIAPGFMTSLPTADMSLHHTHEGFKE